MKKARAESGSVLIMDPKTGGIVAWADYPSYNANDFTHTDPKLFKDNVSGYLYEPGSVMKVVTLSGAINSGKIRPDTVITDPGFVKVGGFYIYDWDRAYHGKINYTYVLEHSLNVGAIKAMQAEGHANCYSYLQAFGLTRASGIDVAGETAVPLPAYKDMSDRSVRDHVVRPGHRRQHGPDAVRDQRDRQRWALRPATRRRADRQQDQPAAPEAAAPGDHA